MGSRGMSPGAGPLWVNGSVDGVPKGKARDFGENPGYDTFLSKKLSPMRISLSSLRSTLAFVAACAFGATATAAPTLSVGSKRFTESYILGEVIKQSAQGAGEAAAAHNQGLGNTAIVLNALTTGSIDVYPEYTGTIAREILKLDQVPPLAELNAKLASMGLAVAVPLGFNNTYALAMRGDDARAKGIARLSDLKAHPELRLGLSQEFIGRADGWPGLKRAYDLPFATPRGIDHGLAYEAIAERQVDAIDIYSTEPKSTSTAWPCSPTIANIFRATTRCCSTARICRSVCQRPGKR